MCSYVRRWKKCNVIGVCNVSSKNDIVPKKLEIMEEKVIFMWTTGRVGIPGNEKVNEATEETINIQDLTNYSNLLMDDLLKKTKNKLISQWRSERKQTTPPHIKDISENFFSERKNEHDITQERSSSHIKDQNWSF